MAPLMDPPSTPRTGLASKWYSRSERSKRDIHLLLTHSMGNGGTPENYGLTENHASPSFSSSLSLSLSLTRARSAAEYLASRQRALYSRAKSLSYNVMHFLKRALRRFQLGVIKAITSCGIVEAC